MACKYCEDVHSAFDPCPEAFEAHRQQEMKKELIDYLCINCPDRAKEIRTLFPME
jgi:hypothetical protein